MRGKTGLPVGVVILGVGLLLLGWMAGAGLAGAGIGCIVAGLLNLAWQTGRHYECR
jgi:hypothetical protein